MTARAHINMETKLASALLALGHIPYDDAKLMTARQVCSLYAFDHNILHAIEANNAFWNLTPRLIVAHRQKSKRDTGIVAKAKALTKDQEDFRRKALARPCGQKRERSSRWPSRKIQSRGFAKARR